MKVLSNPGGIQERLPEEVPNLTTNINKNRKENNKMKDRTRQRENRKLKRSGKKKPWLNHEGYYDPTAYNAIRNIERSTSRAGGQGSRRPALQTS